MKLKRLELFGFKSFLNRTVFQFDEGITSIVGPNGCGKSNIVDAIIWALGERGTKSLRIKDMGDVIFHGSNGKRPVSIAEVCIELSDGDKDLSVKRRIYKDGTNEYYLNNAPARLKDVQDFFLGTGIGPNSYAIIEQGKIESFINMKPQERRLVIEETSGITRFEERKRDAIARMEQVKTNLERVEDIYNEVIQSFEKAHIEWERWKTYKGLSDRLSEVDKQILIDGYIKIKKRISRIQERLEALDIEISKKEEEKDAYKNELEAKENEFSLTDSVIRQLELDIKSKEKDMESRLIEIEYINEEQKRLGTLYAELLDNKKELENKVANLLEDIEGLKSKGAENQNLIESEGNEEDILRQSMEGLKTKIEGFETRLEEERLKLFVSMSRLTDIKNKLSEIERIKKDRQKREERRIEEQGRLNERLNFLNARHNSIRESQAREIAEKDAIYAEEKALNTEIQDIKKTVEALRQTIEKLNSEKRGKEEFLKQMNSYMTPSDEKSPDAKKLIDLINIDEWMEKAIERFFFREMDYRVLLHEETDDILDVINRYDDNYIFFHDKGIFRYSGDEKQGRVEIDVRWIDSIQETIEKIKKGEEGIFINNEICIDSRGFILKEKDSSKIDLQQYRERKKAEKDIKEIEVNLEKHIFSLNTYQERLDIEEKRYEKIKAALKDKKEAIGRYELEVASLSAEIKTITERFNELEAYKEIYDEISEADVDNLLQEMEIQASEKSRAEQEIEDIKNRIDSTKNEYDNIVSKWHGISLSLERKKNFIKTLDEDIARKAEQIKTIKEDIENIDKKAKETEAKTLECRLKIEKLEKDYDELKATTGRHIERYEDLKRASGNLHMERQSILERIDLAAKEIEKIKSRREATDREMAVFIEKKNTIQERLETAYGIEDAEGVSVSSISGLEIEKEKLEKEISALGEVNFRAEKEYTETKERMEFLENQKEDLKNAMESLKKTIIKIDTLSKEIFFETFETVNNAFKRFTSMLFNGGNGHLSFNQEIGGIDMFVQLPGKKVVRMEQLSGGEKALISIAFLLSLMDTNPSPFSLLDEIDAPLDDANILTLLEIIKTICNKTQIIFITHNRITMEASNTIYGVTMEEAGVSKIVSVRL